MNFPFNPYNLQKAFPFSLVWLFSIIHTT